MLRGLASANSRTRRVTGVAAKSIDASLKGGKALERHLAMIARKLGKGVAVKVGFFESERYPGGKYHWSDKRLAGMSPEGRHLAEFLEGKDKPQIAVAQAAFWAEFGTKRAPARPFMRTTVASKSPRWGLGLGNALRKTHYDARAALALMGMGIQGQIRQTITDFKDPPNSQVTQDLKGFNKPLVNTGQMLRAVDFQVLEDDE
jgi:hypothetical protein